MFQSHGTLVCSLMFIVSSYRVVYCAYQGPIFRQDFKVDSGSQVTTSLKDGFCVSRPTKLSSRLRMQNHFALDMSKFVQILPPLQERDDFGAMCESLGFRTGLEIGVQRGEFSKTLLSKWPSFEKFYLLDPWEMQHNYVDIANVPNSRQDKYLRRAKINVQHFQGVDSSRIEFVRGYSNTVHDKFQDKSLDFIYIDARHDYCGVYEDLELYWPKIKCRGVIAGHDYLSSDEVNYLTRGQNWALCDNGTTHTGAVRAAVNDFAVRVQSQVMITYRERYHFNSWYMRKQC